MKLTFFSEKNKKYLLQEFHSFLNSFWILAWHCTVTTARVFDSVFTRIVTFYVNRYIFSKIKSRVIFPCSCLKIGLRHISYVLIHLGNAMVNFYFFEISLIVIPIFHYSVFYMNSLWPKFCFTKKIKHYKFEVTDVLYLC